MLVYSKYMLKRLSHWLVPVKTNKHHPYLLRPLGLFMIAIVLAFIPSIYNFTATGSAQVLGYATSISVGDLHALSNTQRANNGLAAMNLNGQLNQAAYAKAQHMFANNYWAHNAPDGTTPWSFISGAGFSYSMAGENLAKNFSTSAGVVDAWMNSPGHRANILQGGYDSVGYAAVNGNLQGEDLTLVVAMYAKATVAPAPAPAPTPPPAPAPAPAAQAKPVTQATEPTAPVVSEPVVEETPVETPTEPAPTEVIPEAPQTTTEKTPIASKEGAVSAAEVAGAVITAPVKAYTGLNWGQKISLFILSVLLLLFILKHTLVWRAKRKGIEHIWLRSHPLVQASFIAVAMVMTLASGAGSVL